MSRVLPPPESFDAEVPLVIVGAGAAGLCAALAAKEAGADPIVIERDAVPAGSTALSAGLIPAAGTRFQRAKGIEDSAALFAEDIQRKAHGENDPAIVDVVAREAAVTIEWLADRYALPFDVIDNFTYPGHSAMRMHGLPTRSGAELIDHLRSAAERSEITILTESRVEELYADADGRIRGVALTRNDGAHETIGCDALILACNGYGGNAALVRELIPEMADALYFGHPGNQGEAILWGRALGAGLAHLSAHQGHGSVATPHNILITWAVIAEGGFQVNAQGHRFSDETHGYSEQAAEVLRQPGEVAWDVFDARIAAIARQFEDFRTAEKGGALITADTLAELAARMRVPFASFAAECKEVEALKARAATDRFGRVFKPAQVLTPPFHAVKVTGALFHTQGGLVVDGHARVKREDGTLFPNLFAAGGAAAGVSGETAAGYLSGNGLLTAAVLGRLAGTAAAALA
ncbi:FAD-dependent oxidoreductase [Microbacteriaceae bacterium K1510]|nr:FAD-dependent oxidoreductase [Microbacteriaceae bacterium K1510]